MVGKGFDVWGLGFGDDDDGGGGNWCRIHGGDDKTTMTEHNIVGVSCCRCCLCSPRCSRDSLTVAS